MMTCSYFRANLQPGNADAAMLDHLRHCDDAFVGDVVSQVRVHDAEAALPPRHAVSVWQRWAIAATVAVGITGATVAYRYEHQVAAPKPAHIIAAAKPRPAVTATKSFVETYSSHDATIVEMPNDGSDTKVVMIFDDKLPADL